MDLRFHLRILWRWKWVLLGGLVLATVLGTLATFKPSSGGLEWRSEPVYNSFGRVMVTQPGFPLGRASLPGSDPANPLPTGEQEQFAPPDRFIGLAEVYAYLASSQPIRDAIKPRPLEDQITVIVARGSQGDPLPLLDITTTADSAEGSKRINEAVIVALRKYLFNNGEASDVPADQRVRLAVLNPPQSGELIGGRSTTPLVMVFLLTLVGTIGLVYVLENLYPPKRAEDETPGTNGDRPRTKNGDRPRTKNGASEPDLQLTEARSAVRRRLAARQAGTERERSS